jgi:hypothetical protein
MRPVHEKIFTDTNSRLQTSLNILRACRLFNYQFVAETSLLALQEEIDLLAVIPFFAGVNAHRLIAIRDELELYKQRANARMDLPEAQRPSLWDFWLAEALTIPRFWTGAREIALITPSSCTVERAFSLLSQWLTSNKESVLEDYMCASVMLRFNALWHERDADN